ncbi:DUF2953 domain-containing protein [Brevibacillus sp. 179-C9.3 HS]|uniref:DUF2953 domain-containing protein n=1 Tax=unclassified Brevibacillus TaxID=2684853 RepID=UPI0039A08FD1
MVWLLLGLLVLLILIFITPIQLKCFYSREGENDQLDITIAAWGIIRRKYEIPILLLKMTEAGPELVAKVETVQQGSKLRERVKDFTRRQVKLWYRNYRELLEKARDLLPLLKDMFKHIRCTEFEWHTWLGTGQAAETGALTGLIWGVKSMVVGVVSHAISLRVMPAMSVQPVWNQSLLHTKVHMVLNFHLGYLLYSGIKVFLRVRKSKSKKWEPVSSRV